MTRRRTRVAAALAAFALVGTGSWFALSWSQPSLEPGNSAGSVSGLAGAPKSGGWQVKPGASEFVFAQSVRNSGRTTVTVSGVTNYAADWFGIEPTYVPSSKVVGVAAGTTGRPLPVRLAPGEEIYVLLRYRQHRCLPMAPGSSTTFESVQLRYRVFGVGRTTEIPFAGPVTATAEALKQQPVCS